MPVKRGRLKPEDQHKITTNYDYLVKNFDPVNGAMDYLIGKLIFELHDRDEVENDGEKTAQGRVRRFIKILENSGQDAYVHFIAALRSKGDEHIADEIENTHVPEDKKKEPLAWIDELPDSTKTQCLNEADASRLSGVFGVGWEHVFSELGVSKPKIDQAKMNSPHSVSVAIAFLLNRWKQKNGSSAHLTCLLNAMRKATDRCTIEWEEVKKVVQDNSKNAAVAL